MATSLSKLGKSLVGIGGRLNVNVKMATTQLTDDQFSRLALCSRRLTAFTQKRVHVTQADAGGLSSDVRRQALQMVSAKKGQVYSGSSVVRQVSELEGFVAEREAVFEQLEAAAAKIRSAEDLLRESETKCRSLEEKLKQLKSTASSRKKEYGPKSTEYLGAQAEAAACDRDLGALRDKLVGLNKQLKIEQSEEKGIKDYAKKALATLAVAGPLMGFFNFVCAATQKFSTMPYLFELLEEIRAQNPKGITLEEREMDSKSSVTVDELDKDGKVVSRLKQVNPKQYILNINLPEALEAICAFLERAVEELADKAEHEAIEEGKEGSQVDKAVADFLTEDMDELQKKATKVFKGGGKKGKDPM